ncbi:CaiB/BaiF CoA transferase family protein [Oryzobacter sp. R7]|uniref:CaiB/BaiF CoA transferase family protein n=1 Tax=Oryzobacter faecalis TaxID=3388656 RepID=UPI00398CA4E4
MIVPPGVGPGSDAGGGALAGIRVVELGGIGPVPFAGMVLAELGADVVRVDRPHETNPLALAGGLRRSRPSIAVDLKHPDGRALVQRLVDEADVLVEGWRPGVAERLGLGPSECLARNPRLVHGRMTGWGQTGPWARSAGHDLTYAAVSGSLHALGPEERPVVPVPPVADFAGGSMYLVTGILAALVSRSSTGRGQVVDAAMVEGAAHLASLVHGLLGAGGWRDERAANLLDGGAPFYDVYACADGEFVAVGALEPEFWRALVDGLGVDVGVDQYDTEGWPAQRAAFAAAFRLRTRDAWAEHFAGSDACVAPVLSLAEAASHPQLAARGTFAPGPSGHPVPRTPPRLSGTPSLDPGPEPAPGADTVAWLTSHGFSEEEVSALVGCGAVHQA